MFHAQSPSPAVVPLPSAPVADRIPDRIRIAHVYPHARIDEADRIVDAISLVLYECCRHLATRHRVSAWVRELPGRTGSRRIGGFDLHHLPVGADRLLNGLMLLDRLGLTPRGRPARTWPTYYLPFALRLARGLRRERVDLVHLHSLAGLAPLLRRLLPEIVVGLHIHDHALADFSPAWGRRCLRAADFAVACSGFVAGRTRDRLGDGVPPIHPLPNGVDEGFFAVAARPAESRRILFVGRLAPEKGVHLLIEAFARVAGRFPDATLELIGPPDPSPPEFVDPWRSDPLLIPLAPYLARPGSYGRELRRRAAALGSRIRFAGPVDNIRLPPLLADAGLLVMPSIWQEPFGIPVVEAMAAGLPVVTSDAGAFPETVRHGLTGLLTPRGDVDALAEALARLLADDGMRARLGAAGRRRARERFTWERQVERLEAVYHEALAARTGGEGRTEDDRRLAASGG